MKAYSVKTRRYSLASMKKIRTCNREKEKSTTAERHIAEEMAELESISTAQLIRLCKQKSEETQKQKLQLYGCPTVVFTYMRITGDLPIIQLSSLTCVTSMQTLTC